MAYQMVCDCEVFEDSMDQIGEAQMLAWQHGCKYTGAVFVFCPWCGKELTRRNYGAEMENRPEVV